VASPAVQVQQNRVDVSVMMAQQAAANDVFAAARLFLRERKKLEERRKAAQRVSPMQARAPTAGPYVATRARVVSACHLCAWTMQSRDCDCACVALDHTHAVHQPCARARAQAAARNQAAETMAREVGGWFASFGFNIAQQVGAAAAGYRQRDVAAASCGVSDQGRVGCRKRPQQWNATRVHATGNVPDERALVPVRKD
jgi:hypothetical protein